MLYRWQPEPYKWAETTDIEAVPDRVLIRHYLHYWHNRNNVSGGYAIERETISPELRRRGYDPTDISDLERRLS